LARGGRRARLSAARSQRGLAVVLRSERPGRRSVRQRWAVQRSAAHRRGAVPLRLLEARQVQRSVALAEFPWEPEPRMEFGPELARRGEQSAALPLERLLLAASGRSAVRRALHWVGLAA